MVEHAPGQPLTAVIVRDRDLPDEQRVLSVGTEIAGDEAGEAGDSGTDAARDHGGRREVAAPEEVVVPRVHIEGSRLAGQSPHTRAVHRRGRPERRTHLPVLHDHLWCVVRGHVLDATRWGSRWPGVLLPCIVRIWPGRLVFYMTFAPSSSRS